MKRDFQMTQDELKQILNYNPITGIFTWIKTNKEASSGKCAWGYKRLKIAGKTLKQHRLAWLYMTGHFPEEYIDHINGIKTDNRFCNLREATNTQNQHNRIKPSSNSSHNLIGITWNKEVSKWCARISVDRKRIHLGYFDDKEIAHQVYLNAKRKYHTFAVF